MVLDLYICKEEICLRFAKYSVIDLTLSTLKRNMKMNSVMMRCRVYDVPIPQENVYC